MRYLDSIGLRAGLAAALFVIVLIFLGSRNFRDFDWALTTYAVGTIFAAFAVAYRYAVWAQRPPTRMYLKRGWQVFWRSGPGAFKRRRQIVPGLSRVRKAMMLGRLLLDNFVLQKFITQRGLERWVMHTCLSWGGILAFALTFPLVFGWIHFEALPHDATIYQVFVWGFPAGQFPVHSFQGLLLFNLLNISAVVMLVGLVLSVKLRMNDKAELALQTFADDVFPILLLFAVSTTGLMLTVSARFMAGSGFPFIGMAHAASVIGLLLYLPFGKLFHIIQRPLSLGVAFYRKHGEAGEGAHCLRCGESFGSRMHVEDLKTVLDDLGFDFRFAGPGGAIHYQDICPSCRRRLLALNQGRALGR